MHKKAACRRLIDRASAGSAAQRVHGFAVEPAGGHQALVALELAQRIGRARAPDAIHHAGVITLVHQALLGLAAR